MKARMFWHLMVRGHGLNVIDYYDPSDGWMYIRIGCSCGETFRSDPVRQDVDA